MVDSVAKKNGIAVASIAKYNGIAKASIAKLNGVSLAAAAKVLTYQNVTLDNSNLTTYSFASQAIGTASSDRRVIVAVHSSFSSAASISSATIGGISATIVIQNQTGNTVCGILIANVPTGTTATVAVTFSSGRGWCGIGVWSCTGLTSNTEVDSDFSDANPATATLTSVAGGFCVSAMTIRDSGVSITWSGGVTEKYDATSTTVAMYSGASDATAGTTITPVATPSAGGTDRCAVFATW